MNIAIASDGIYAVIVYRRQQLDTHYWCNNRTSYSNGSCCSMLQIRETREIYSDEKGMIQSRRSHGDDGILIVPRGAGISNMNLVKTIKDRRQLFIEIKEYARKRKQEEKLITSARKNTKSARAV